MESKNIISSRSLIINSSGDFDQHLLSCIKDQSNAEAISTIQNQELRDLFDSSKRTLLHYAAEYNNSYFAQYLIDNGCDVNARNRSHETSLMTAVFGKNEDVVMTLLGANAEIDVLDIKDRHLMIPLMTMKSEIDLRILKLLFDKMTQGCSNNNEVAHKLLEMNWPFPAVIFLNDADLTKSMINLGCKINDRLYDTNETALHLAVHFQYLDNVKVLLDFGADIKATDWDHRTPLLRFDMCTQCTELEHHKLEIIKILLNYGASLTEFIPFGETAIVRTLLSKADSAALQLLMPYIDFFGTDDCDNTPLHYLAENKNPGIIDVLQDLDCDLNARDGFGLTPLDIAIHNNSVELAQFLLEKGATANNIDNYGCISLGYILLEVLPESDEIDEIKRMVELLLQYGADARLLNKDYSFIFEAIAGDKFLCIKPVVAHLAMIESHGKPLTNFIYKAIESDLKITTYFELCKQEIIVMQNTIISDSVTVYMLLHENKEKIVKYAQDKKFVISYNLFTENNQCCLDAYYMSTLYFRVGKTIAYLQTRQKAALIICEIMGLPSSMDIIGYNIVKYLHRKDLDIVLQT